MGFLDLKFGLSRLEIPTFQALNIGFLSLKMGF